MIAVQTNEYLAKSENITLINNAQNIKSGLTRI